MCKISKTVLPMMSNNNMFFTLPPRNLYCNPPTIFIKISKNMISVVVNTQHTTLLRIYTQCTQWFPFNITLCRFKIMHYVLFSLNPFDILGL